MIDKILDVIPFTKFPLSIKLFIAKILLRMMSVDNMWNDINLYNELREYIKTNGRPTTSSPWFWINKHGQ